MIRERAADSGLKRNFDDRGNPGFRGQAGERRKMNIECPHCESVYAVEVSRVPGHGGYARCAVCRFRFRITSRPARSEESGQRKGRDRENKDKSRSDVTVISLRDNFGRRSGVDRRRLSSASEGEKRNGSDRRNRSDRRNGHDRRNGDRRGAAGVPRGLIWPSAKDFYPIFDNQGRPIGVTGPGRREGNDRRSGMDRRDFMILDFE